MQGRKRDWSGVVQGKLTVLNEAGTDKHGNILWDCLCACGTRCIKPNRALAGGVKSCSTACGVSDSNKARIKHGGWRTKEYMLWQGIKQRCYNPNSTAYASYGGRGVTMHPTWVDSFEQFLSDVGTAPDGKRVSLDRIDNEGNYEPTNVRWATPKQQSNNRRVTLKAEVDGEVLPLADVARKYGVSYHQVFERFMRGLRGNDLLIRHKVGRKPK